MLHASRETRSLTTVFAVLSLSLTIALSFGCGGSEDEEPGTGRVIEGEQCFLSEIELFGDAGIRRASPICEPEEIDPWACVDNMNDLDTEPPGILDFCANTVVFGEVAFQDGDPNTEMVDLTFLAQNDEGRAIVLVLNGVDLNDIGVNEDEGGVIDPPLEFGACDFTAGISLDVGCDEYLCDWNELSPFPCGGIVATGSTEVPVVCYEDEHPDPCDPGSLTWGMSDTITLKELMVVELDGRLTVLERTIAGAAFDITLRSEYEDGTHANVELSGEFRTRVGSNPFSSNTDLSCSPCYD